MHKIIAVTALLAASALAGCGNTDLERGVTGGAIGAVGAAALGGNALVGGAIGASAGVLCDDLTPRLCR
jgi:hypothetical protein